MKKLTYLLILILGMISCNSSLVHRESQDNYLNTSIEDVEDIKNVKEG